MLGFTIPRVPSFSFNDSTPIAKATGTWNSSVPTYVNTAPANFSFPAFASLRVDTNSNYLPLKFNYLRATIFDLDTLRQIATGDLGHRTLPAKSFPDIMLPLNFTYVASNSSDQTCKFVSQRSNRNPPIPDFVYSDNNMYLACRNRVLNPDNIRPRMYCFTIFHRLSLSLITALAMKIRLVLDMGIAGLPSEHHASTQISDAACPIELSQTHG